MRREWFIPLLLAALTLIVYWPVGNYEYIHYDDPQFIAENELIRDGISFRGVVYAFTEPVVGNWHPVTVLSHMLDCHLFGQNAGAHHLVNVVIHALNGVLLFFVLRALSGRFWPSAFVAALFVLHPLRVESVAWISERKDVLSGLFFLLTLFTWERYIRQKWLPGKENRKTPGRLPRFDTAGWPLLFFALGLMSKPMLVTVPFVLLLLDVWPLKRLQHVNARDLWPLLKEKLPYFALAAACSAITLLVQRGAGAMTFFTDLTLADRLANVVQSYVRYLGKFVWPTKLAIVYPHPAHGYYLNDAWPAWQVGAAAAALALITLFCLLRLNRQPYLAVGWFWFLGTLVPVIGLVQVGEQAMANRYTYIPLIGLAVALVWGLFDLFRLEGSGQTTGSSASLKPKLAAAAGIGIGLLVLLIATTQLQVRHWRNTVSLFSYAISVTPDNPSAQFALGVGMEKAGEVNPAKVQYRVALAIEPKYTKANYNLGQIYSREGPLPLAEKHFAAALQTQPQDFASRVNLANTLQRLGRNAEAVQVYEDCLRQDPASTEALNNLAWILATSADPQLRNGAKAVELSVRAVELSQSHIPVMIGTLAAAYAEAGRFSEAIAAAQHAADVARRQGQTMVAERNLQLLEVYRMNQPYHEQPGRQF